MKRNWLGNLVSAFLGISAFASLVLAAACTSEAVPHWSSVGSDAGTTLPSVANEPADEPDAGTSMDPEPDPGDEPTCVGGKPAFYLRGDNNGPIPWDDYDVVYPFELELDEDNATFTATTLAGGDGIRVDIESNDDVHKWHAILRTRTVGEQLQPGVYEVEETLYEKTGPTMDINAVASNYPAQSRSCAYVCGSFEVLDIQVTGSRVDRFSANFAQHCACAQAALRGCVNFTQ